MVFIKIFTHQVSYFRVVKVNPRANGPDIFVNTSDSGPDENNLNLLTSSDVTEKIFTVENLRNLLCNRFFEYLNSVSKVIITYFRL